MKLNVRASERHFLDHLAPIWHALNPDERGVFSIAEQLHPIARQLGIQPTTDEPDGVWLVASWGDLKRARTRGPVIYMEHGAGQRYADCNSGSYIGGPRDGVIHVLVPGPIALEQHQALSTIPATAIGCPKLDPWHTNPPQPDPGLVAITHHWDCYLVPETRSAFRHFYGAYRRLAADHKLLGHAHPRAGLRMARHCATIGAEYADHLSTVLDRASILIADNTSAMFEFASLGRPVIALNPPWYRKDVHHGLRFWSHVPGVQVHNHHELIHAVHQTQRHPVLFDRIHDVYAVTDGTATKRAVEAIREVLG